MTHVAEREDYHLIDDLWFSYKIRKSSKFLLEFFFFFFFFFLFCHHHFRHRYQSGPDFSEMNNDADLIFS